MPIKGLFQGNEKDSDLVELHEKIEALEKQVKKINTLEVYMQHFLKVEERLGLMKLNEKLNKDPTKKNKASSYMENKEEVIKVIESNMLAKVQQMIRMELDPIQKLIVDLHSRISTIEKQVSLLEKQYKESIIVIQRLQKKDHKNPELVNETNYEGQPIIFQEIHVDKLFMDKYEQTNNLGQLGIKELSGHLNIGATYDKGIIPNELVEEWKEEMNKLKEQEIKNKTAENGANDEKSQR